jgi:curved DNA-binding protein
MKYKDFYQTLGVERNATIDEIKKAYRKLAHKYHPDVTKDPKGEEKFKEIAEAYATLKNSEKRKEYDALGNRSAGDDFSPPPGWQSQYGATSSDFDDVDLSDLFNSFRSGGQFNTHRQRNNYPENGQDYSVSTSIPLETIFSGGKEDVSFELPELDEKGLPHRQRQTLRVTIPVGAKEGQRLRLAGKGGAGINGGKAGDLYVVLSIQPHPIYSVKGLDLYFDLLITPWEAVLGTSTVISTMGGNFNLSIKPGTSSGIKLRLSKQGLHTTSGAIGDLYAVIQIVVPKKSSDEEYKLYEKLATISHFKARENSSRESVQKEAI